MRTPVQELDAWLKKLIRATRILPALTPLNALAERIRLMELARQGTYEAPAWQYPLREVSETFDVDLAQARRLALDVPGCALYLAKLDELAEEMEFLAAINVPKRMRALSKKRYPQGSSVVSDGDARPLRSFAEKYIGKDINPIDDSATIPARDAHALNLSSMMKRAALSVGLTIDVKVEPRMAASAATSDRTVFLADRLFTASEALRLTVHEVLGHLVTAANGRKQPLRIFEWGTAGSFADHEGFALVLEELTGTLDAARLRTLAARVLVTDWMHSGADFAECVRLFVEEFAFSPREAVIVTERAYRGGGLGRDASYLYGFLRVRHALAQGKCTRTELWSGKMGLHDVDAIRELRAENYFLTPSYRPNLVRSLRATLSGTSFETSPPSVVASLTKLELT